MRRLIACLSVMVLTASHAGSQAHASERPPGRRFILTDGQLFISDGYRPEPDGVTLTLHLHGAAWAVERSYVQAKQPGVLVTVVLPGLSSVYREKFRDPAIFRRILEEAGARLQDTFGAEVPLRQVVVTSFSAGFGGVRELLKDPEAFRRIDALVMLDSIHAGFTGDPAARQVDAAHMEGFLRYAREAAAGKKALVISHSALHTPGYASTTETADYLLRHLGPTREPADEEWEGGLKLTSRCRTGRFAVYGFSGETGADHMKHLHGLHLFLQRILPLPAGL